MTKLTPQKPRKIIKVLNKLGFKKAYSKGSHVYYIKKNGNGYPITITIPHHAGKDIGVELQKRIIEEIGLTREEFLELL